MFVFSLLSIDCHLVLIAELSSSPNPVLLKQLIKVFMITTHFRQVRGQAGDKLCRMLVLQDTTVFVSDADKESPGTGHCIFCHVDAGTKSSQATASKMETSIKVTP